MHGRENGVMNESAYRHPGDHDEDAMIEQVFLSPRVVDERAFTEFSQTLKGLLRDATGQSRLLMSTTGEIKTLSEQLRTVMAELQKRIEIGARLVPTIEQRAGRAQEIVDRVEGHLAEREKAIREITEGEIVVTRERVARQVDEHATSLIQEKAGSLWGRMSEREAEMRQAIESDGERVIALARQAETRFENLLSEAERRAAAMIESAQTRCTQLFAEAERKAAEIVAQAERRATESAEKLQVSIDATTSDCRNILEKVNGDSESTRIRCEQLFAEAESKAVEIVAQAEQRAAGVAERLQLSVDSSTADCRKIMTEMRAEAEAVHASARSTSENLAAIVAESIRTRLAGVTAEQESLLAQQVAAAHAGFKASASEAEARLEGVTSRADQRLETLFGRVPENLQMIEDHAGVVVAELEKRLARYKRQTDEMIAAVASVSREVDVARITKEADEVARFVEERTGGVMGRLQEAAGKTEELLPRAESALAQLDSLHQQADQARQVLSETLLASAGGIDSLDARLSELRKVLEETQQGIHAVAARAGAIDAGLTAKAEQCRESLEEAARPVVTQVARQVQHMGKWLSDLMLQAKDISQALEKNLEAAGVRPAALRAGAEVAEHE